MFDIVLVAQLLLGAAALVCVWFVVRGLIDMQRINTSDPNVLEMDGVVRQVSPHGRYDSDAVITLNVEDEVIHVDCRLPGPWIGRRNHRVTDMVRVFWRRGDKRAVAADTIRDGQRMFLIGFVLLAASAVLYVLLF